jgi:hypothetical protein
MLLIAFDDIHHQLDESFKEKKTEVLMSLESSVYLSFNFSYQQRVEISPFPKILYKTAGNAHSTLCGRVRRVRKFKLYKNKKKSFNGGNVITCRE